MARKKKNLIFEKIEVIDAGARGKTVAKAPDGRVIFLTNTVPEIGRASCRERV